MSLPASFRFARVGAPGLLLLCAAGCSGPLDMDLRGNVGAFSTASAAQSATTQRPAPDARGVISYPNYQVVVAQKGETVATIATRLGFSPEELGRFNGIDPTISLRKGEIVALPRPVAPGAPTPLLSPAPGGVDIEALAGQAIDSAPDSQAVETTALPPAEPAKQASGPEPTRHKVVRGETAYTIARLYSVSVQSLAEWNGLDANFTIREGQQLLIPVARSAPPTSAAAPVAATAVAVDTVTEPGAGTPTPTPPSASKPLPEEKTITKVETPDVTAEPQTIKQPEGEMAYPVQGKIIRAYVKGKSDGIDISGSDGAAVSAAKDGTVAAITEDADKVPIVVLRHSGNMLTVYANVSNIAVAKDQVVKRGQRIANLRDGDNAYVHFEVRDGFESVDPMDFLE